MSNTYGTPAEGESYPAATPGPSGSARNKRWTRWGVGAVVAGLLAGGGITLAATSGGGSAAASPASDTQATALNSALSTAASNSAAIPATRVRWALRRLAGVEGTVTLRGKTGFHTLSFERGTIQSVSGSEVVIKSPDGTTWSWQIVSDTVVRKNGSKTTTSALSAGETVFAGGPVVSGARDARLIVIRPASASPGAPATPGPAGSGSAQTSLR